MLRASLFAGLLALLALGCRSVTPPAGEPLAPLKASSPDDALRMLQTRAAELNGARSLMRMRATNGGRTTSFKAQLQIDSKAMLLVAYTPVNTTAMRVYADDAGVVFLNDVDHTAWKGGASDFSRSFGFFGALAPRDAALLLLGFPASRAIEYQTTSAGLSHATAGDVTVTYDPPSFPANRVTIVRGPQKLEIESLGVVASSERVEPLTIPADYRCCVAPRI